MYTSPLKIQYQKAGSLLKEVENNYNNNLLTIPVLNKVYETNIGGTKDLKMEFSKYESKGSVTDAKINGNNLVSYLWDYKQLLPVARVAGALSDAIAYTSFEAEGKGNWTFSGTPGSDVTAPTGKKAYTFNGSNSITKTGLNNATDYIISYWTKNATAFTITGTKAGYPIAGRIVNGWKYFEHKIGGQTSVNIGNSGLIDELRLYPAASQMVTITYDPVTGMTSQCDANNVIAYYEYDGYIPP